MWSLRSFDIHPSDMILSCLLVFTVLIYVYPLRFMFGMLIAWLSQVFGGPFSETVRVADPSEVNRTFVVYGIGFIAMSAAVALLNLHAWRKRATLELTAFERHETRVAIGAWLILAAVGAVSVAVADAVPPSLAGLPGWVYAPWASSCRCTPSP